MALTTLIVDDEQLARDELAYLLKSVEGVDIVAQGKNGVEAVSLIKEHEPDLGFLDVLMRAAGRMILVDQRDICYASIEDGVITVYTSSVEGESNCRTLEELADSLDANLFWRAHRSYLVNINRIKEVVPWFKSSYQLRMDDKKQTEIPVSRAQTKRLRELFGL